MENYLNSQYCLVVLQNPRKEKIAQAWNAALKASSKHPGNSSLNLIRLGRTKLAAKRAVLPVVNGKLSSVPKTPDSSKDEQVASLVGPREELSSNSSGKEAYVSVPIEALNPANRLTSLQPQAAANPTGANSLAASPTSLGSPLPASPQINSLLFNSEAPAGAPLSKAPSVTEHRLAADDQTSALWEAAQKALERSPWVQDITPPRTASPARGSSLLSKCRLHEVEEAQRMPLQT